MSNLSAQAPKIEPFNLGSEITHSAPTTAIAKGSATAKLSADPRIINVAAKCIVFGDVDNVYHATFAAVLDRSLLVREHLAGDVSAPIAPAAIFFQHPAPGIIDSMLQRGYQQIYVPAASMARVHRRKQTPSTPYPQIVANLGTVEQHRAVTQWALPDLPVQGVQGMSPAQLLDLLCLDIVDGYVSPLKQTRTYAVDFFAELELLPATSPTIFNRMRRLQDILGSYRGIQIIEDMIRIGGGRRICCEQQAKDFIATAPISAVSCIVCPESLATNELRAGVVSVADFLVTYNKEKIIVTRLRAGAITARLLLVDPSDTSDDNNAECAWSAGQLTALMR